jgi:hypothetical protein
MSIRPNNLGYLATGSDDSGLEDHLRRLVDAIAEMAQASNIKLVAHRPESFIYYQTLPVLRKQEILRSCESYYQICVNTLDEGRPLSDTRALLWSSLKYFGFVPTADLMDFVTDERTVELYDAEGRQIFRNFKFMEICSYTLADVLLYPWWELFRREEEVVAVLIGEMKTILSGEITTTMPSANPYHRATEVFSERRHELDMRVEYLSPMFSRANKRPAGFVCIADVKVAGCERLQQLVERPRLQVVDPD